MNKDLPGNINYQELVDEAMRGMVLKLIKTMSNYQITGEHYFLITFKTDYAGVILSEKVKQKYPDEMTIILQHQYDNLEVVGELIKVNLSFDGVGERVVIPLASIMAFVDPSTKFALQFQVVDIKAKSLESTGEAKNEQMQESNVIRLDQFRKK